MKRALLNKGRVEYINLNKKFLKLVENGASWDELQPVMEEMKSLAVYLQQIPTNLDVLNTPTQTNASEISTDRKEEPV